MLPMMQPKQEVRRLVREESERFLPVATVAELLNVSKPTVISLIRQGELPAIRIGKVFRIASYGVDDYLARAGIDLEIIRGGQQPATASAAPSGSLKAQSAEHEPTPGCM